MRVHPRDLMAQPLRLDNEQASRSRWVSVGSHLASWFE